jgi:dolichol-phosphate mannosyltransferase
MISVVVPILNEPGIASFLDNLHDVLRHMREPYEIIVVQGDNEKLYPDIPVKPHQRTVKTYGDSLERSILNGFSHAKGDKIIVIDADSSHPIDMIPDVVTYLEQFELVVGSRKGEKINTSKIRGVITTFFIKLAKFRGSKLSDPMSGFFGVRKEIIDNIPFKPITWKTCLEISLKAKPSTYEIPFSFGERSVGESKASLKIGLKLIKDLLLFK